MSGICFNLDQPKNLLSGNELKLHYAIPIFTSANKVRTRINHSGLVAKAMAFMDDMGSGSDCTERTVWSQICVHTCSGCNFIRAEF